ncbi:hypothetical protein, partial [Muribaculum sp.]|uniref:hypothetical protein n=1 Tax=Muribaculum sp. TaxID=1918611 RepID=UPI002583C2F3
IEFNPIDNSLTFILLVAPQKVANSQRVSDLLFIHTPPGHHNLQFDEACPSQMWWPPTKNLAELTHLIVETTWKFHIFVIGPYLLVNNNRNNNPNNHRYDFESTQIHSQKMDSAENGIARILFQTTV